MVESKFFFLGMYLLQAFRIEFLVDLFFSFFLHSPGRIQYPSNIHVDSVYFIRPSERGERCTSATSVQKRKIYFKYIFLQTSKPEKRKHGRHGGGYEMK